MNSLVVELLELSKLESKSQPFNPVEFDLGQKIASVLSHLSLQFEQNGITVVNNVPSPLMCYAQEEKIEIAVRNYVTNAVSHCSGEKRIELNCADRGECVEIKRIQHRRKISPTPTCPSCGTASTEPIRLTAGARTASASGLSIVKKHHGQPQLQIRREKT